VENGNGLQQVLFRVSFKGQGSKMVESHVQNISRSQRSLSYCVTVRYLKLGKEYHHGKKVYIEDKNIKVDEILSFCVYSILFCC
jgi:hypothetical protein